MYKGCFVYWGIHMINILESIEPEVEIKGFYILDKLIIGDIVNFDEYIKNSEHTEIRSILGAEILNIYTKDRKYVSLDLAIEYLDYHSDLVEILKDDKYIGLKSNKWEIIGISNTLNGLVWSSDVLFYNVSLIDINSNEIGCIVVNYGFKNNLIFRNVNSFLRVYYCIETEEIIVFTMYTSSAQNRCLKVFEDSSDKKIIIENSIRAEFKRAVTIYIDTDIDCLFGFLYKDFGNFVKLGDCIYILSKSLDYYLEVPDDCRALLLCSGYMRKLEFLVLHKNVEFVDLIENKNKLNSKKNYYGMETLKSFDSYSGNHIISSLNVSYLGDVSYKNFDNIFRFIIKDRFVYSEKDVENVLNSLKDYGNSIVVLGDLEMMD